MATSEFDTGLLLDGDLEKHTASREVKGDSVQLLARAQFSSAKLAIYTRCTNNPLFCASRMLDMAMCFGVLELDGDPQARRARFLIAELYSLELWSFG